MILQEFRTIIWQRGCCHRHLLEQRNQMGKICKVVSGRIDLEMLGAADCPEGLGASMF